MSLPPPAVLPDLVGALRRDLSAYTVEAVAALLGPVAGGALDREQQLPADLLTRGSRDPVAALVRLFALGRPAEAAHLDTVLPHIGAQGLLRLGLAVRRGSQLRATCDLRPHADESSSWWLASDLSEIATGRPLEPDHVLGVGGASTTLASWMPRPPARTALDLGTGCGVQAMHLDTHTQEVVGTDTSRRALAYARFNATLNDVSLDLRHGSLFQPVSGERFDLVTSNPPFVITPRRDDVTVFEYRDGGLPGDSLLRRLIGEVGDHLEPGGIAQLLGNWEVPYGGDWREVVRGWLSGTTLDAWVVQRDVQDPAQYAELWARDGGHLPGSSAYEGLYGAWLEDFAARGVESVGFGVLTLQRPPAAAPPRLPWRELADEPGPVTPPMGPVVLAGIRARTWLAEHGAAGVLATSWRCADDVTEERHYRPGETDPRVILVRQGGGLGRSTPVDTVVAGFVGACDGTLPAGAALDAIAELLAQDPVSTTEQALPAIQALVADGLLVADL